jgi:F0F1-type ATP synthase membrane subunit b/b'
MTGQNGTNEPIQDVTPDLSEISRELREKANEIRKDAVSTLHQAAETIRREARENTEDDGVHKTADDVATGLEKAANYLNNHSVEDMGAEATQAVKNNPLPALLLVLGIGLIIGLLLRGGRKS